MISSDTVIFAHTPVC